MNIYVLVGWLVPVGWPVGWLVVWLGGSSGLAGGLAGWFWLVLVGWLVELRG